MRFYILFLLTIITPLCTTAQNDRFEQHSNPAIEYYRQQLTEQVMQQMNKIDWNHVGRRTSGVDVLYTIPVVVHVLHNYGAELIPDDEIFNFIDGVNSLLLKTTPDTANIIDKYKAVAASTQIAVKLATKDPYGYPTKGIEHINTYLNSIGYNQDQAKINQWPPDKYLNIWITSILGTGTAMIVEGNAYTPFQAAYAPYYDGIFLIYQGINNTNGARLIARSLNLPFPCQYFSSTCTDYDGIPDTPPCAEDMTGCAHLYDSTCDTPNRQNLMYGYDNRCSNMFTYGQSQYMKYVIQTDIGKRDSLVTPYNFKTTGMDEPMADLPPIPDFCVKNSANKLFNFFCADETVRFDNKSWNDTISDVAWTFSNDALTPTSSSMSYVINKFHQPGWVSVTIAATGNNSGTTTMTSENALYVADRTPTNAAGYYQEFNEGGDLDKWPIFNYFHNSFRWTFMNRGYYDNTCIAYEGYDYRPFPQNMTGSPMGDHDDFFTPFFDISGISGSCYLNFMSSGATRTYNPKLMFDVFEIYYSVDMAKSWQLLKSYPGYQLANKGTYKKPYKPSGTDDWIPRAILLPASARTPNTVFCFRYRPGADSQGISTSNYFYLDRFNINTVPEDVAILNNSGKDILLYPNPTIDNAFVVIKQDAISQKIELTVTDITGKEVYHTISDDNTIEIPKDVLAVKGIYLVHIVTNKINQTKKLLVY